MRLLRALYLTDLFLQTSRHYIHVSIQGIALDGDGNIVIADLDNHRVRMLTPHGVVTTMAGTGGAGEAKS